MAGAFAQARSNRRGAGIGGLCAAIGLRRAGHDVAVLERAAQLGGIGSGLTLFQNAMGALNRLGVREAVAAQGARGRHGSVLTSDGRELTAMPADLLVGTLAIHRGDLQATLAHAVGDVRLGAEVTSVEQRDDVVVATIADGTEERADLLVGADGIDSVVRGVVTAARPRFAGYTAWRGVAAVRVETGRMSESWGLEDAVVLVDALARHAELAPALAGYESIRRPRTTTVLKPSLRVDRVAQLASPLGCRLRNAVVRRVPERTRRPGFEAILRHEL